MKLKLAAFFVFIAAVGAVTYLIPSEFLSLDYLKSNRAAFAQYYENNSGIIVAGFVLLYITSTALSLPGATVITLAGGAIFGFWLGLILVSFSSTVGATLAFLISRFFLRDYLNKKFGPKLSIINDGLERDGRAYLFTLRLVPAFPFFLVNMLMGLTAFRTWPFMYISWIGMLPGTMAYVNAGTQIAALDSLNSVLSPRLILSFAILGLFPLVLKWCVRWAKNRKGT